MKVNTHTLGKYGGKTWGQTLLFLHRSDWSEDKPTASALARLIYHADAATLYNHCEISVSMRRPEPAMPQVDDALTWQHLLLIEHVRTTLEQCIKMCM
eukprot:3877005-Amphidinium_carterae.1